jgi:hypothetical protein
MMGLIYPRRDLGVRISARGIGRGRAEGGGGYCCCCRVGWASWYARLGEEGLAGEERETGRLEPWVVNAWFGLAFICAMIVRGG